MVLRAFDIEMKGLHEVSLSSSVSVQLFSVRSCGQVPDRNSCTSVSTEFNNSLPCLHACDLLWGFFRQPPRIWSTVSRYFYISLFFCLCLRAITIQRWSPGSLIGWHNGPHVASSCIPQASSVLHRSAVMIPRQNLCFVGSVGVGISGSGLPLFFLPHSEDRDS